MKHTSIKPLTVRGASTGSLRRISPSLQLPGGAVHQEHVTVGPVLNAWFNDCVWRFFAYIANSMIVHVDAAAYGVLLLDLLLCIQMIANPRKTRN